MTSVELNQRIQALESELEMFRLIFDSIHNGALVTDADGIVTHFNKPYGKFLGMAPKDQIGRHCTEVLDNTRMHIVANTGLPEINQPHMVNGQNMVVQRIPITNNDEVIAVFGQVMFKDIRDVRKLADKLALLESKVKLYEEEIVNLRSTRYTMDSIIGRSRSINALKKEALKATGNSFPILITGESGTGKELFAQAVHHGSSRKTKPFVRINCAAIPKDLLESELFGYAKGAFTGAHQKGKAGKFELAHRGTVFLDEIGDLPLEMQPKLLRVLEEKEFERVGSNVPLRSDFRLIAATNQNLEQLMSEGRFRKDLYYRLNVIALHIPPLRERPGDIMPIAGHLLRRMGEEILRSDISISKRAAKALVRHDWPGNVRELSNVLERAISSTGGTALHLHDLPFYLHDLDRPGARGNPTSMREIQAVAEREAIQFALKESGNNKARAARRLGIHRTLLYKKMKKHGLPL